MDMVGGVGLSGVRYRGEQRVAAGARRVVEVPAARNGRLAWAGTGGLILMGEGLRGRWVTPLAQGEMLLICPGERVWARNAGDHVRELRLVEFTVQGEGLRQWVYGIGAPAAVRVPGAERMLDALAAAAPSEKAESGEPHLGQVAVHFRAQAVLYELMAAYLAGVHAQTAASPLLAYVEQVRTQMAAHCEQEYNIEVLARASGVSPHRFYQVFREMTGLTPHKYLAAVRLRQALRLLAGGFRSVAEVAHAVGYQDELYFSRVFRRELGLAPSAFAQLARVRAVTGAPEGDLAVFGLSAAAAVSRRGEEETPGWRQRVERLGRLLGLEGVAAHWVALMERRLCHLRGLVRSRLGESPFVVAAVEEEGVRVYGVRHPGLGDLLYGAAGFTPDAAVTGTRELRLSSPGDLAALGCRSAVFLVGNEEMRADCEAAWLAAAGDQPGAHCLSVLWPGQEDAAAYEHLVEQLTLRLIACESAAHTRQKGYSMHI